MRRFVARLLLALAVAALAPTGYLHALTHLGGELARTPQKGDSAPQAAHGCALCAAYSAADGGAPSPAAFTILDSPVATPVGRPAEPLLPPAALTRFASRAPPLSA
jgi:hypothetical protein